MPAHQSYHDPHSQSHRHSERTTNELIILPEPKGRQSLHSPHSLASSASGLGWLNDDSPSYGPSSERSYSGQRVVTSDSPSPPPPPRSTSCERNVLLVKPGEPDPRSPASQLNQTQAYPSDSHRNSGVRRSSIGTSVVPLRTEVRRAREPRKGPSPTPEDVEIVEVERRTVKRVVSPDGRVEEEIINEPSRRVMVNGEAKPNALSHTRHQPAQATRTREPPPRPHPSPAPVSPRGFIGSSGLPMDASRTRRARRDSPSPPRSPSREPSFTTTHTVTKKPETGRGHDSQIDYGSDSLVEETTVTTTTTKVYRKRKGSTSITGLERSRIEREYNDLVETLPQELAQTERVVQVSPRRATRPPQDIAGQPYVLAELLPSPPRRSPLAKSRERIERAEHHDPQLVHPSSHPHPHPHSHPHSHPRLTKTEAPNWSANHTYLDVPPHASGRESTHGSQQEGYRIYDDRKRSPNRSVVVYSDGPDPARRRSLPRRRSNSPPSQASIVVASNSYAPPQPQPHPYANSPSTAQNWAQQPPDSRYRPVQPQPRSSQKAHSPRRENVQVRGDYTPQEAGGGYWEKGSPKSIPNRRNSSPPRGGYPRGVNPSPVRRAVPPADYVLPPQKLPAVAQEPYYQDHHDRGGHRRETHPRERHPPKSQAPSASHFAPSNTTFRFPTHHPGQDFAPIRNATSPPHAAMPSSPPPRATVSSTMGW